MSATLSPATSEALSPAAYSVVNAARLFRLETASRNRTTSSAQHVAGNAAILRQRGLEVQPIFRQVARAAEPGRRPRFPGSPGLHGHLVPRRRRGLNWAIGNSCLRDGLQHPHPLRQETLTKSRCARRGSGLVQSRSDSTQAQRALGQLERLDSPATGHAYGASLPRLEAIVAGHLPPPRGLIPILACIKAK